MVELISLVVNLICIAMIAGIGIKMHQRVRRTELVIEALKKDFGVICGTTSRSGSRIMQLEKQIKTVAEKQEKLELRDPVNHSYGQAIAMAKKGMGVDELVNILGLPRGEAELIALMHDVKKAS